MKHRIFSVHHFYFVAFLCLCSCSGCDIDRTEVSLSRANSDPQLIDLTTGKCLVNEIEADIKAKHKAKLRDILSKQLEDIFDDSIVFVNTIPSARFDEKIPFEIAADQLEELRKSTSYTYLLSVRATNSGVLYFDEAVNVDIVIFDLDTRNRIYNQTVKADEIQPENDSKFTFWLGHSDHDLMKSALRDGLRDLKRGVRKFNRSQGQN